MDENIGFVNIANSCYINSTLQLLLSINDFIDFMDCIDSDNELIIKIKELIDYYKKNTTFNVVKPTSFLSCLFKNSYFERGSQEDAHEFLLFILDYIHENTKSKTGKSIINTLMYSNIKTRILCECGGVSNNNEVVPYISIQANSLNINNGVKPKYMEKITCILCMNYGHLEKDCGYIMQIINTPMEALDATKYILPDGVNYKSWKKI